MRIVQKRPGYPHTPSPAYPAENSPTCSPTAITVDIQYHASQENAAGSFTLITFTFPSSQAQASLIVLS
jgi:hypothetical protein